MKAYAYSKSNALIGVFVGLDWEDCIDKVVERIPEDILGDFFPYPLNKEDESK